MPRKYKHKKRPQRMCGNALCVQKKLYVSNDTDAALRALAAALGTSQRMVLHAAVKNFEKFADSLRPLFPPYNKDTDPNAAKSK